MNQINLDSIDFDNLTGITGEITSEDIESGIACDHEQCALAQAMWRMFPGYTINIDDDYAEVSLNEKYVEIGLSDNLRDWIYDFDNGKPVNPVELRIDVDESMDWILNITGPYTQN